MSGPNTEQSGQGAKSGLRPVGAATQKSAFRRFSRLFFQLGLVGFCLWYLLSGLDFTLLARNIARIPLVGVLGVAGFIALDYFVMALRMKSLLPALSLKQAAALDIVGNGMNILLPAKLGEVIKIRMISRYCAVSAAHGARLVFWIRFIELNILLVIALLVFKPGAMFLLCAVAGLWCGVGMLWFKPALAQWFIKWIPLKTLRVFCAELAAKLSERPGFLRKILLYSLAVWLFYWLQYYWGASYLLPIELSFAQKNMIFLAAAGLAAIPGTPGAIGTYEAGLVFALSSFGIGKEEALVFSLCMRVILYVPIAVFSVIVYFFHNRRGALGSERPEASAEAARADS